MHTQDFPKIDLVKNWFKIVVSADIDFVTWEAGVNSNTKLPREELFVKVHQHTRN